MPHNPEDTMTKKTVDASDSKDSTKKISWIRRFFLGSESAGKETKDVVVHEAKGLVWAIVIAVMIRTFLFDPFNIPSSSMKPTLLIGDFLFVSKYSYGYSKYSIPFSPNLFEGRLLESHPKQGDVIVFRPPFRPFEDWIKRVIGLPGDIIQMREGVLYINNKPCPLEKIEDFIDHLELEGYSRDENRVYNKEGVKIPQYIETLPNGVQHRIIKKNPFGQWHLDNTEPFVVPEGHFFVMGDNRDGSEDSRVMISVGYIPFENLVGKAQIIFFSTVTKWYEFWNWLFGIRYERFFNLIR